VSRQVAVGTHRMQESMQTGQSIWLRLLIFRRWNFKVKYILFIVCCCRGFGGRSQTNTSQVSIPQDVSSIE